MLNPETIYQKVRQLDACHLQEVADFVDFILNKIQHAENQETAPKQEEVFQPSIALQRSGLMGCAEGQPDLAENYKDYLGRYWMEKHDHR